MNVTASSAASVHPFLDGKPKRMLIDGKWLEAASGKTFATVNPATGQVLAQVAEGDAEDIERAVAAARRAFDGPVAQGEAATSGRRCCSSWPTSSNSTSRNWPRSTRSTWARRSSAPAATGCALLGMLRYYAGQATAIHGETIDELRCPASIVAFTLKEPVGVVGAIIPWNGAAQPRRSGRSARRSPPAAPSCSSRRRRRR